MPDGADSAALAGAGGGAVPADAPALPRHPAVAPLIVAPGVTLWPGFFDLAAQRRLRDRVRACTRRSPFFTPRMPRTGRPWSVRMTNLGPLGWVSDEAGYRYQPHHPVTGAPWPAIPRPLLDLWRHVSGFPAPPECCLVNLYRPGARMGLHRDADEQALDAPVVSVSLGDEAVFRLGGLTRKHPTGSFRLRSGDVLVLGGENRLAYHGVDRVIPGTSSLLRQPGRLNLTLRRVNHLPGGAGEGGRGLSEA